MTIYSESKVVTEFHAVAQRQRAEQESTRRELGVVFLVGEILRPGRDGPLLAFQPDAQVDEIDRIARGRIVRLPPGLADVLVVGAQRQREIRRQRLAPLRTQVVSVLRYQRRLVVY